jgi:hypothetical protein
MAKKSTSHHRRIKGTRKNSRNLSITPSKHQRKNKLSTRKSRKHKQTGGSVAPIIDNTNINPTGKWPFYDAFNEFSWWP